MNLDASIRRASALTMLTLLAACGGGTVLDAPRETATAMPASATPPPARKHALFTIADSLVNEALAATLLPYIEQTYPAFFPGPQPTLRTGPYAYRCYPATGNCVGLTSTDLYVLGPVAGGAAHPVRVSSIADFCRDRAAACGITVRRQVVVAGLTRHYIVYLPWKAAGQTQTPVVFMLHGTTGTGDEFLVNSGWREKADAEGLIAVFPTALRHCFYEDDNGNGIFEANEIKSPTKWADSLLGRADIRPLCSDAQRLTLPAAAAALTDHPLADDVAFFRQMVTDLTANFAADARRIYVSGFSNGGQMALRLAHEASTIIAAAASNAGAVQGGFAGTAARQMSMIYAVGDQDDRYTDGRSVATLPLHDVGTVPIFLAMVQPFLGTTSLASSPYTWQQATLYGDLMSIYEYRSSTAIPAAGNVLYTAIIQGLTHRYPSYMPDALWSFFRDQSLP